MAPPPIDPASRRIATTWLGRGLLFVAIVLLLEHARPLLLPVTIAIVFTFVLSAPVRALRRAGIHEYIGAGAVIVAVLGTAVLILMLVAAPAAAWWSRAPQIVHELVEALQGWRDALFPYATPAPLIRAPATVAAPDLLGERLASEGWIFTRLAIGETISFALSASATVILLYFLLASEQWLVARTVAAVRRPRTRALILAGVRQAQRDIGLFIATMSLVNLALGVATGLALWLVGLPNPVLWGTTAAVLAFIPYLGPLLITLLLLLAGSVTFGTGWAMLGPPAAFLVLHGVEANFLSPMIMGHRLRLRPVFV
ncbi:MAG TPA: AI-2E family transporter, partial [Caldimonas sp.]